MVYGLRFLATVGVLLGAASAQSFRPVALPDFTERVTGVYCTSATACVISTDGSSEGHIYASDGQTATTLITGDYALGETFGTLGTLDFVGFSAVGDRVIAHLAGSSNALLAAPGDITQAGAWQAGPLGIPDGAIRGGNQQIGLGSRDGRWVYFSRGTLFETSDEPGAAAFWEPLWSPNPPGEVPSDFLALYRDDPRLCAAEPGVNISPPLTQSGYVAADLAVILYPAGARNQSGEAGPGVCISTDGGKRFYHVPFPEVEGDLGPLGVTCSSPDHCAAYGGLENEPDSAYIYVTTDAQQGADSSWQRATLPALREDSRFRGLAFAPGGQVGWAVGSSGGGSPLALTTADGGLSWTDATSQIRSLAPASRLHTVYLFDEEHVWIGGENGTLLTNGN